MGLPLIKNIINYKIFMAEFEAIAMLKKFKERFEPYLKAYFQKKLKQAGEIDIIAEETLRMIMDYTMAGGKRIRPAFLYFGYLAAGGNDEKKILETSMCVELLHSFLLIHDDIMDRDASRHGVPTLHERFKNIGKKYKISNDSEHFGNSMAMMAGDITAAMACEVIFNSKFPAEIVVKALDKLQDLVFITAPGEMMDMIMEYSGKATEEEILKMHEGKTARYTFEGPLHLGCLLAGGDEKMLEHFSKYALPLGKAFQIQDDILGIFGDKEKIGKPVGSDIIEGKQTLLVIKTLELGNSEQKNIIKKYLGKKDLTSKEAELFKGAVKDSGALEYSQNLAEGLINESLTALREIDFRNKEAKVFLEVIAKYVLSREI